MSEIPLQLAALGGIGIFEILIGATGLLTVIASVCFFIGDKREREAAEIAAVITPDIELAPAAVEKIETPAVAGQESADEKDSQEEPDDEPEDAKPEEPEPKSEETDEGEIERQFIEDKLKRIADKRAESKKDEPEEVKVYPKSPRPAKGEEDAEAAEGESDKIVLPPLMKKELGKVAEKEEAEDKPTVPDLPPMPVAKMKEPEPAADKEAEKPAIPDLPKLPVMEPEKPEPEPVAEKEKNVEEPKLPDFPPMPVKPETAEVMAPPLPKKSKPGSDLPPQIKAASIEDEADLQTREQERDV